MSGFRVGWINKGTLEIRSATALASAGAWAEKSCKCCKLVRVVLQDLLKGLR